ncbi:hypothetical protein SAMN05880566_14118 [Janthinobacterium sp. TND4EL3]|nr:hypothetical protein SAMN05880566_14118 [Janthinobacterium sp. TND4EL3]
MLQKNSISQYIKRHVAAAGSTHTASNLLFTFHVACWHPMLVYGRSKIEYFLADQAGATYQPRVAS